MVRIAIILCLILLATPALADDTHAIHLEIFRNSTGHVQLVRVDNGSYQNCEGGDCFVEVPNTTVRWLPCNQTDAVEIAEEVVDELRKHPNYQPLSEERIDAIVVNSSTFMKDSWMAWADMTLMPNVATLAQYKGDLGNCTQELREAQMSRQNIIDKHQPEIENYERRIADLEADNKIYTWGILGALVIGGLFLLKEKGFIARKYSDKVKNKRGRI